MSETKTTGNFMKELGMTPEGEIEENPKHTVIFNLKRNLEKYMKELIACRKELIACEVNNNNLINQIKLLTGGGGRKRKKTKRKRRKKTKRSRRK
jgi:hypothetical protein